MNREAESRKGIATKPGLSNGGLGGFMVASHSHGGTGGNPKMAGLYQLYGNIMENPNLEMDDYQLYGKIMENPNLEMDMDD